MEDALRELVEPSRDRDTLENRIKGSGPQPSIPPRKPIGPAKQKGRTVGTGLQPKKAPRKVS